MLPRREKRNPERCAKEINNHDDKGNKDESEIRIILYIKQTQ